MGTTFIEYKKHHILVVEDEDDIVSKVKENGNNQRIKKPALLDADPNDPQNLSMTIRDNTEGFENSNVSYTVVPPVSIVETFYSSL